MLQENQTESFLRPLFEERLELHRPLKKEKVLNAIRDIRGGKLNSSEFGDRMRGSGAHFHRPPQPGDQVPFEFW